jgi:hypothetical protein
VRGGVANTPLCKSGAFGLRRCNSCRTHHKNLKLKIKKEEKKKEAKGKNIAEGLDKEK